MQTEEERECMYDNSLPEPDRPHVCVPTLDGNAHVIPTAVFTKIILGEMKITDLDDWEIIARTAFSEWLRELEKASKARAYKAALDEMVENVAAAWQSGPAPKDGSWVLGIFDGRPHVVFWHSWQVEPLPGDDVGSGNESGWVLAGDDLIVFDDEDPEEWARIIPPDRKQPAPWENELFGGADGTP